MDSREDEKPVHKREHKVSAKWVIGIILLVLLGSVIGVKLADSVSKAVKVPSEIVDSSPAPIYLPKKLPGNYLIMEDSFTIQEEVLIFQAKDGAGGTIIFTEQDKPKELNFEDFYAQQFTDTKTLGDVPFPSVTGKSNGNGSMALSVVTDDTWIMASTRSPLSSDDLKIIAETIREYKK